MRAGDIQVGQDYAIWHGKMPRPERNSASGWNVSRAVVTQPPAHGDVFIRIYKHTTVLDDGCREHRIATALIRMSWSECEKYLLEEDRKYDEKEKKRDALIEARRALCDRLDSALGWGVPRTYDGLPKLDNIEQFEALVNLIELGRETEGAHHESS
jgi:hypothetical protein